MLKRSSFPMICAHTGCGVAPDNSIASSEEGCALGADMVEVDVRVTKDGVAVLMHDDTPLLREYTFEQLNHYDVRSTISETYAQHEITKLQDVLNLVKDNGIWVNLDIKHSDSIEPTEDMKHCAALQVDGITTRKVTDLIDIRNNQETYNNMESLP